VVMIQTVEHFDATTAREVSDYLAAQPAGSGACPEHDPRWLDVLREGLGHQTFMMIARSDGSRGPTSQANDVHSASTQIEQGDICGYLPLALVSGRLFGRFLVSLPYVNRAGVVAQDQRIAAELIDQAVALSRQLGVKYLELRDHGPDRSDSQPHASLNKSRSDKVRMVLSLPGNSEALWQSIGAKVRNQVRKGDKSQLSIRWGGLELLDDFYSIFAVNMRDLGTPVYSKQLFRSIIERFDGQGELAVVDYQSRPVAASVLVHSDQSTQIPSASSLREFNHTNANMWMYHRLLLRAMDQGSGEFDFGRSSEESGTYRFKKQWGAVACPTQWRYHLRYGDMTTMRPDSPKNRRRIAVWKKLPVWLTQQVGPMIVRGIP